MKPYTPRERENEAPPSAGFDGAIAATGPAARPPLEGIALRRNLGMESKNRRLKSVYIEAELLQALGPCDLNFQVNLALEHLLTKHPRAHAAVHGLED